MAEEQTINPTEEELIVEEPDESEDILIEEEEKIEEDEPSDLEIEEERNQEEEPSKEKEETIVEEPNTQTETIEMPKKIKKKKIKRKRSFFSTLSPFEITTIVLGILIAIALIAGFWYLYNSAKRSSKAVPKSGLIASDESTAWMTRVVNANTPLNQEFAVATSAVTGAPGIQVDSRATKETVALLDELKKANSDEDVNILAGYTSIGDFAKVYNASINNLMNNQDMSYEEAVAATNNTIRPPGTDEHSLGLLINFGIGGVIDSATFKETKSYDWLKNNAWKYGYIERYPEGKEGSTGHNADSTSFRYVGKEIAEKIYEAQQSLEEYNAAEAQRQAEEDAQKAAEEAEKAQAQQEAEQADQKAMEEADAQNNQ